MIPESNSKDDVDNFSKSSEPEECDMDNIQDLDFETKCELESGDSCPSVTSL